MTIEGWLKRTVAAVQDPLGCAAARDTPARVRSGQVALRFDSPVHGSSWDRVADRRVAPADPQPIGPVNAVARAWWERCAIAADMEAETQSVFGSAVAGRPIELTKQPSGGAGSMQFLRAGMRYGLARAADGVPPGGAFRGLVGRARSSNTAQPPPGWQQGLQPSQTAVDLAKQSGAVEMPSVTIQVSLGESAPPAVVLVRQFQQHEQLRHIVEYEGKVLADFASHIEGPTALLKERLRRQTVDVVRRIWLPEQYAKTPPLGDTIPPDLRYLLAGGAKEGLQWTAKIFPWQRGAPYKGQAPAEFVTVREFEYEPDETLYYIYLVFSQEQKLLFNLGFNSRIGIADRMRIFREEFARDLGWKMD